MKTTPLMAMALTATVAACTNGTQKEKAFTPTEIKVTDGLLTPEIIWQFGRVGAPAVSPDGSTLVFAITYTDMAADRSYADIYTMPAEGGTPTRITSTNEDEYQVGWRPDGKKITYLATKSKSAQLWEINPDGTNPQQVTDIDEGIDAYAYSPDMSKILVVKRIKLDQTVADIYPDLPKANARIETDLMYRHWNAWHDYKYSHVLVADYANGKAAKPKDIMEGERYHSPLMPFGGIEQIAWTPDGKQIAYTCKKLTGKASATSTNSDIYLYDIATGETKNLTDGMMGYDMNPKFSADGSKMFWMSMERDGYESDKTRIMMRDMQTGSRTDLTEQTELYVSSFALDADGQNIWFTANDKGCEHVFRLGIAGREITKLTTDTCDYTSVADAGKTLIATRMSMSMPTEIFSIDKSSGTAANLSNVNADALAQIDFGKVEERYIATTDGKKMQTWVIYPPRFDPNKKYPALLYCQGGPQQTVSQFWSMRWNFQLMAANGYVVVAPNRRGLPGFGREWNEQISGDYGGQNMQDYLAAIDAVAKEPFVDENRLGAVGASYGGFSVYWLAGNHNKRFKAFVSHCGIFNFDQMYVTTEELFFTNWDMKGAFWDYDNPQAMKSYAASPHLFVNNWDTPILVIHGEKDFRIPYTQGMAAFNAAVIKDIPAEFLYFPDECHWVLKPQNSILWHREFKKWLDKWLK